MRGHMKSQHFNHVSVFGQDSPGNQKISYEEKVKLFKAKRYSIPMLLPEGTKNWITRDYIRYIDQSGRWYPLSASFNMAQRNSEYAGL